MNVNVIHALLLCYISGCLIQDHYALIETWSGHLGKPYKHKTYGSALAE
jgi:hypothetical protein